MKPNQEFERGASEAFLLAHRSFWRAPSVLRWASMQYFVLPFFLLFLFTSSAIASCDSYSLESKLKNTSCNCTSKSPQAMTYPKELKLTHVCNFSKVSEDEIYGHFFFKSRLLLSGHIRHEESDGGNIYFVPASQNDRKNRFATAMKDFRFEANNASSKFHTPMIDAVTRCWIAPASLWVNSVHISLYDSGGAFIQHYDILRLGKYRKCKSNESGFSNYVP